MAVDRRLGNRVPEFARKDDAPGALIDPGPYVGIVRNNNDPTYMGRLQVWIPDFGGNADDPENWRTVQYASPFSGHTYINTSETNNSFTQTSQSYGFWMVPPDVGVKVLVIFVAGDPFRGFWFACVPSEIGHHMIPGLGSTKNVDTEFIAAEVDPLVNELVISKAQDKKAYTGDPLPVSEFDPYAFEGGDEENIINAKRPIHEYQFKILVEQGLWQDISRGTHTTSSQRETPSRVFGFSSPGRAVSEPDAASSEDKVPLETYAVRTRVGGHSLVMDDGDTDGRNQILRLKSAKGHTILMNDGDDGGMIYIINKDGTSWIEMTNDGTINIYGKNNFNLRTEGTLNLHADQDININAGGKINLSAGGDSQLEAKNIKFKSGGVFAVSSNSTASIRAGSDLKLTAGGTGSFGASDKLIFNGSCIGLNSGSAPQADTVTQLTRNKLPETSKEGNSWKVTRTISSIVTVAPTHEPFVRNAGQPSPTPTPEKPAPPGLPETPSAAVPPTNQDAKNNLNKIIKALNKRGITDVNYITAVLANVMKESGGKSISENLNYANTSNDRIRSIFGARAASKTDDQLNEIKKDPQKMAELMYGYETKIGSGMGNTQPGDGWKYRGRGFIQITGKNNYSGASQDAYGDDRLIRDPDLANDPDVAAEATAWFMKRGLSSMASRLGVGSLGTTPQTYMSPENAQLLATSEIAGTAIKKGNGYLGNEVLKKVAQYSQEISTWYPGTTTA